MKGNKSLDLIASSPPSQIGSLSSISAPATKQKMFGHKMVNASNAMPQAYEVVDSDKHERYSIWVLLIAAPLVIESSCST